MQHAPSFCRHPGFFLPLFFLIAVLGCGLLLFWPDPLRPFREPHALARLNWPAPDWQMAVTPASSRMQLVIILCDQDPGLLPEHRLPGTPLRRIRLQNPRPISRLSLLADVLTGSWAEVHGLTLGSSLDALPPIDLISTLRVRGISTEWLAPARYGTPPAVRWQAQIDGIRRPGMLPWKRGIAPGFRCALLEAGERDPDQLSALAAEALAGPGDSRDLRLVLFLHDGPSLDLFLNRPGPPLEARRYDLAIGLAQQLGAPPPPASFGRSLSFDDNEKLVRQREEMVARLARTQSRLFPGKAENEAAGAHLARLAIRAQLHLRFLSLALSLLLLALFSLPLRRLPGGGHNLLTLPLLLTAGALAARLLPNPSSLEKLQTASVWHSQSLSAFLISFAVCLLLPVLFRQMDRRTESAPPAPAEQILRDCVFLTAAFFVALPYFAGLTWNAVMAPFLLPGGASLAFLLRLRFLLIGLLFALALHCGIRILRGRN